jgi:hypothetical protein
MTSVSPFPLTAARRQLLALCAVLAATLGPALAEEPAADARGMLGVEATQSPEAPKLLVRQLEDLHFGRVVAGPVSGGAVRITPLGQKTVSGGASDLGGGAGPAEFEVIGPPGTSFSITLPPSASLSAGGTLLQMTDFDSDPKATGLIPEAGRLIVRVGATLHLAARVQAGQYQGGYEISIDNQ